jgi:two-component system, chemotaxis family, response regulator PixG
MIQIVSNPNLKEGFQEMEQSTSNCSKSYLETASLAKEGFTSFSRDRLTWSFYFADGRLLYATNSLKGFEMLERHLRRLSREHPSLKESLSNKVMSELRLIFDELDESDLPIDYRVLSWLVSEQYLSKEFSIKLIMRMIQEVLETFLALPDGEFAIERDTRSLPGISCAFDLDKSIGLVSKRLQAWFKLGPSLYSPCQRPYLVSQAVAERHLPPETVQQLGKILRGYNFYQIAAMLGRDELIFARQLQPLIRDGAILLRDPVSPLDLLPAFYRLNQEEEAENLEQFLDTFIGGDADSNEDSSSITQGNLYQQIKTWNIACIDDSQAMLNEIERLLDSDQFKLTLINDSLKALMKLSTIRPDLILMDVGMPNVDGYQLCTLIRKTQLFKETPVVMVTGHKGLLDRARARLAGATDYLTKPFTKDDLLAMVMRNLI